MEAELFSTTPRASKVDNERVNRIVPLRPLFRPVPELMGWVRNVVLMNVYLDLGNPGGSGFWVGGYMSQVREWGS
jgi:hypothetical protein